MVHSHPCQLGMEDRIRAIRRAADQNHGLFACLERLRCLVHRFGIRRSDLRKSRANSLWTYSNNNQQLPGTTSLCCRTRGRSSTGLASSPRSDRRRWFLRTHDPRKAPSPAEWRQFGRTIWVALVHASKTSSVSILTWKFLLNAVLSAQEDNARRSSVHCSRIGRWIGVKVSLI